MSRTATPADVLSGAARWACIVGDVRETLRALPDASVQCVVTSPPYWGLRDYGCAGQIGMEPTPAEYVATMRALFAEIRRVLRDDGTAWLNLGDSYAATTRGSSGKGDKQRSNAGTLIEDRAWSVPAGLKPKDLVGIPWRVAFALQEDGWWLRSDIVWAKPNPMPESVTDRPTRAHEYVFLLTKRDRYFYDADAIREGASADSHGGPGPNAGPKHAAIKRTATTTLGQTTTALGLVGRNARTVWNITPEPFDGAHFATMPPELARRCILAGSRKGDVVLDPFGGSGTTALVAVGHGRRALLCELNPAYATLQRERLAEVDTDHAAPLRVERADFGPLFAGGAR